MESKEPLPVTTSGGCLVRFYWLVIGNLLMLACLVLVAQGRGWTFSPVDLVFWANVALLVAMRYWDIRSWDGRTGKGEPASMADWKKYAFLLPVVAGVLWVGAHFIASLR